MDKDFEYWLSTYLETDPRNIENLLGSEIATIFFVLWTMFESDCFSGFAKQQTMEVFTESVSKNIKGDKIEIHAKYFHERYKDKNLYANLIFERRNDNSKFKQIIDKSFESLNINEKVFLLIFVIYRYRNNIFHGNKGIESWLKFEEQIKKCIELMQYFMEINKGEGSNYIEVG